MRIHNKLEREVRWVTWPYVLCQQVFAIILQLSTNYSVVRRKMPADVPSNLASSEPSSQISLITPVGAVQAFATWTSSFITLRPTLPVPLGRVAGKMASSTILLGRKDFGTANCRFRQVVCFKTMWTPYSLAKKEFLISSHLFLSWPKFRLNDRKFLV